MAVSISGTLMSQTVSYAQSLLAMVSRKEMQFSRTVTTQFGCHLKFAGKDWMCPDSDRLESDAVPETPLPSYGVCCCMTQALQPRRKQAYLLHVLCAYGSSIQSLGIATTGWIVFSPRDCLLSRPLASACAACSRPGLYLSS